MSGVANGQAAGAEGKARQGRAALGVGMSEDANAHASGAEPQAAGAAGRRAAAGRGGGARSESDAASGGVPKGNTPLELFPSATMGKADNFSTRRRRREKSISGCILSGPKVALVKRLML